MLRARQPDLAGVNIYDSLGFAGACHPRRTVIGRVICVLPLFHIYALITILLLSSLQERQSRSSLRQRFDVESHAATISRSSVRATAFPGVPTMWIALANASRGWTSRDFSSLTALLFVGRCAAAGRGGEARFQRLTGQKPEAGAGA